MWKIRAIAKVNSQKTDYLQSIQLFHAAALENASLGFAAVAWGDSVGKAGGISKETFFVRECVDEKSLP